MELNTDLPKLPKGWMWTRVGDVISNLPLTNRKLKKSYYLDKGKYPVIDQGKEFIGGYTNKEDYKISSDIPLIVFGDHTKVFKYINFDFVAGADGIKVIRSNELFYPKLFYFFAQAIPLPEKGYARHFQWLEKSFIPLPPLPEQHRIVNKIEELFTKMDAGVDALKKVKIQLKRYRQAVLKNAFEGKLTQQWREAHKGELEPASVLLEKIKDQRKKESKGKFKELPPIDTSELPELPEGWVWTRLGEISIKIHYGYTARAIENNVGPKLLRITDIQNNSVNWNLVPYCKIENFEREKYLLNEGDLVFARTGATVGKSFLIKGDVPEAVFASYLIRTIINNSISKKYVFQFFQSNFYWDQIQKVKVGIGQPNVNAQILSQLLIPLPPLPEQNQIVADIESCLSVADQLEKIVEQNLKQAEKLHQSILKQAFEGKLVPQDPTDEPAEKLLERIKVEKEIMGLAKQKSGKRK
ncbi:MAG: restriction endonuclease subunit S [Candidatus Methanofastidiosa archaeon]|nr:restriction endonuclease subunit S [Candidatus Methanofastidiosa archaeon]